MMNRPYIFCHMMTSLDGKITGNYMETPEGDKAGDVFYEIAFGKNPYYQHQGWLSGRVTSDENFTFYKKPQFINDDQEVKDGDYLGESIENMYYVSIDPSGKLGWQENTLTYGDTKAYVLEVLTEKASNRYKAYLRRLHIPYIIAGKDELDKALLTQKLYDHFHIETLMLGGGGVLNWSFIQAGMCDEISIVMAPVADGDTTTPALFEKRDHLSDTTSVGFSLKHVEVIDEDIVWLRYQVKG